MDEKPPRTKRAKEKPPPKTGEYVVFLTHRTKLGAPIYLAPDPDRPHTARMSKCSTLRNAARFPTRKAAERYRKLYRNPEYTGTVGILHEKGGVIRPEERGWRPLEFPSMEE